MTVAAWRAATLYSPGDIVRSTTAAPVTNQAITNPGFESGDTDWSKSNTTIENVAGFTGAWRAKMVYAAGATGYVRESSILPVAPGQSVTASCMYNPSGASIGVGGQVRILWYDGSNVYIPGKDAVGNGIDVSNGSGWRKSSVTGSAPSNAAGFRVQGDTYNTNAAGVVLLDAFALSVSGGPASNNFIFKATQAAAATSGTSEPIWPTTLGGTVVDGGVTWEAIDATVITWKASPILKSGSSEPTWPTNLGDTVADGSIAWEVVPRRIEDENCPNSKVVLILQSKVYATDGDIVRFSATANPKDWTSEQDAGYLPTGLQSSNANDMAVLAQYRGNLVPMNANCMQNWQVDPDPAAMAILDQMEGIGSTWNKAAQPVANDLFYLSQLGVRSIGIAASTNNLAAGDIGMPVDELVQDAMIESAASSMAPLSTYYPGAGQYWLAFPQLDPVACSIATTFQGGKAVPSVTVITIGSDTGPMIFNFATGFCPDKAEVWIGGVMVLDTGWWGDPSWQDRLDAACAAVGISSGTINAIPNLSHDTYEQWDAGEAAAFAIDKNTADTTAIVKIYAPVGGTAWKFRLGCPNDLTVEPKPDLSISGNVPDGYVGDTISGAYTPSAGVLPYGEVVIFSGTFPPGLTLNVDGTYSGAFTTDGSYSWAIQVIDAAGQMATVADTCVVGVSDIFVWRYQPTGTVQHSTCVFIDEDYIAVGHQNNVVTYSADRGVMWASATPFASGDVTGLVKYNGDWYAFGNAGGVSLAAKCVGNSFSFSPITAPTAYADENPSAFVQNGYVYHCPSNNGAPVIFNRFDGSTYVPIDTGIARTVINEQVVRIASTADGQWLVGLSSGKVLKSSDLELDFNVVLTVGAEAAAGIADIDGRAYTGTTTTIFASPDDGDTWDSGSAANSTNGLTYLMKNGYHFISGSSWYVFTSPTGLPGTWTQRLDAASLGGGQTINKTGHATVTLAAYPCLGGYIYIGDVS